MKILVIEDDDKIRDHLITFLNLEGFDIVSANNGLDAIEIAKAELPDLIICDVVMPKMNGYEVLGKLRQDFATQSIPFIFLTGMGDKSNFRQGMELGADDYLTKPFTPEDLKKSIKTRLDKQAIIQAKAQEKLDQLRSSITLALPHELHTPLTGIISMAEFLQNYYDVTDKEEALEILNIIEISGNRLYALIEKFLIYADLEIKNNSPQAIAKLQDSQIQCYPKPIISTVVMQKAQQYAREADLQMDIEDVSIKISKSHLKKAIEELVDNAFKFSSPDSLVRIYSSVEEKKFNLFIIDHGRGMTAEQIASVGGYMQFERKLQEQQGSGLGLIIAKRYIELNGGQFVIESIIGKKTTVRLTLSQM